jgi:hypothetical protein
VSTEPRDQRVAHAQVRARKLELLGSPDHPPVFHVFEEFYARSLHDVEQDAGPLTAPGRRSPHKSRRRREKGGDG